MCGEKIRSFADVIKMVPLYVAVCGFNYPFDPTHAERNLVKHKGHLMDHRQINIPLNLGNMRASR